MTRTSTPEPWSLPMASVGDMDREKATITRLKDPAARVYARELLAWWSAAPAPRCLSDYEAHRVYLRMRRLIRDRERRNEELHAAVLAKQGGAR